jgi:hypothetical protein
MKQFSPSVAVVSPCDRVNKTVGLVRREDAVAQRVNSDSVYLHSLPLLILTLKTFSVITITVLYIIHRPVI